MEKWLCSHFVGNSHRESITEKVLRRNYARMRSVEQTATLREYRAFQKSRFTLDLANVIPTNGRNPLSAMAVAREGIPRRRLLGMTISTTFEKPCSIPRAIAHLKEMSQKES